MKRLLKTFAIFGITAAITGCATAPQSSRPYDESSSRALNLATAAGIQNLKDQKVSAQEYKNLASRNYIFDAAWAANNYINPAHGISSGAGLGIALAESLFGAGPSMRENSIVAWMPESMASDLNDASYQLQRVLVDAIEKAMADAGIKSTGLFANEQRYGRLIGEVIEDTNLSCGPYAERQRTRTKCRVLALIKDPEMGLAPEALTGQGFPAYAFLVKSTANRSYVNMHRADGSSLNEMAFYTALSQHLPEWAFLYLAPRKVHDESGETLKFPLILHQGKVELFVSPDSQ